MNITRFEAVGIFTSVALMSLALFLLNMQEATDQLNPEGQSASIVLSDENPYADLSQSVDALGNVTKLVIDDVVVGSGDPVEAGDTVSVHYIGTLTNGAAFDNSYVREMPFEFTVGDGKVIAGWEEGVVGMRVGGQRILVIPPDMAYGAKAVGPIPANSTLVFAIELLEVNK